MQAIDDAFFLPSQDLLLVDEIAMLVFDSEEKSNDWHVDILSLLFLLDIVDLFLKEGPERS